LAWSLEADLIVQWRMPNLFDFAPQYSHGFPNFARIINWMRGGSKHAVKPRTGLAFRVGT
jgi:hypothetical protein